MNKFMFILLALIIFTVMGCSKEKLSGHKPPEVIIKIGNENYETKLGTYCWKDRCADTDGPVELLKGTVPIKVKPGEMITLLLDYEPKPNEFYLIQFSESNKTEVVLEDNSFSVPTQKGVYYYSYSVWWMDDKVENLSHGDAFYAFVLEVE